MSDPEVNGVPEFIQILTVEAIQYYSCSGCVKSCQIYLSNYFSFGHNNHKHHTIKKNISLIHSYLHLSHSLSVTIFALNDAKDKGVGITSVPRTLEWLTVRTFPFSPTAKLHTKTSFKVAKGQGGAKTGSGGHPVECPCATHTKTLHNLTS